MFRSRTERIDKIERHNGLKRLFPLKEDQNDFENAYNQIQILKQAFYHIAGRREYRIIAQSQFEKLYTNQFVEKCKLKRIDLTLIF